MEEKDNIKTNINNANKLLHSIEKELKLGKKSKLTFYSEFSINEIEKVIKEIRKKEKELIKSLD